MCPSPSIPHLLFAVVEQGASGSVPTATLGPSPVDRMALLARLGGDRDLLAEVTRAFLESCPADVSAIKVAIDDKNASTLRTAAHALRGAAANMSADALSDAAQTLERLGEESRLEPADAAWRLLSVEAAAVMDSLRKFDTVSQETC